MFGRKSGASGCRRSQGRGFLLELWVALGGAIACTACSLSAGPVTAYDIAARPSTNQNSYHGGVQGSSYLRLPGNYELIAGVQSALSGQFEPATQRDQWRFGLVAGYGREPRSYGTALGFEAVVNAGFLRGDIGDVAATAGLYAGARVGVPIRIGREGPAFLHDGTLQPFLMLVPELGFQPVVAFHRGGPPAYFLEPFIALNVRLRVSSGLVP
jgi:hypothetical protein